MIIRPSLDRRGSGPFAGPTSRPAVLATRPAGSDRRDGGVPALPLSHVRVVAPAPEVAGPSAPDDAPDAGRAGRASALADESGSLVTEYGLVAVLGATIAGIAIKWASGGAIFELLGALMQQVRVLVGV